MNNRAARVGAISSSILGALTQRAVFGFYHAEDHAREALRVVRKGNFLRSAVIHRTKEGDLTFFHAGFTPLGRCVLGIVLASILVLLAIRLGYYALPVVVPVALFGFAVAWFGTLWLGIGIRKTVLETYGSFVLPGESLVAVQVSEDRVPEVIAVLQHVWHPSVFTIRTEFTGPLAASTPGREPVASADLPAYAEELARAHRLDSATRSRSLRPLLQACERAIERDRADLAEAGRVDRGLTRTAEWLLDNTYVIRSHIAQIRHNLPDNHNRILPLLANTAGPVRYRIYHLAGELIDLRGNRLTPENIIDFLDAYQRHAPLTIAELWVFPLMLRLVLLERLRTLAASANLRQRQKELVDFWASRLRIAVQHDPAQFARLLTALERESANLTPYFYAQLSEHMQQEESALVPLQKWIEDRTGASIAEIVRREHAGEAHDLLSISSVIGSLRQLSELAYPPIVESVSRMEAILREDPAGIHANSDFETRDRCRRAVEGIARLSKTSELEVARAAVSLTGRSTCAAREQCVAYYLIDEGRRELEKRFRCRIPWVERDVRFLQAHATSVYLVGLAVATAAILGLFLTVVYQTADPRGFIWIVLGALALFPASELANFLLQTWLAGVLPPRVLPKMSFEDGIPDDCRTLVAVPMMLLTPDSIRSEVEKLEVRYLSNSEENLYFALISDFTDAEQQDMPEDGELLRLAIEGIDHLNARHAERFTLFHRQRTWCASESRWIGWERKRGKLEELNAFLNGEGDLALVRAGSAPPPVRYVITLDSDTQLPHNTARRLIETIAHPLNRVELTADGRNRARGYSIIQPRVSITLPSATATRFTRLFTDARGTDPYCQAVSDVYQDLTGEAIYHGKAIYDVQAFHRILRRRFPEQRLLSHDLIEGAYVGVGLASDIELFEQFPYDYTAYAKRQHRWIRGDWQIGSWILPRVPTGGAAEPNPLSLINRWKILDNLRRSLIPAAFIVFLLFSWSAHIAAVAASALVAMVLVIPFAVQLMGRLIQRLRGDERAWREAGSDFNRALVMAAFLPHQAYIALDAIVRSCYRMNVSKRHLLEWQIAELSSLSVEVQSAAFRLQFFFISILSAVVLILLSLRGITWDTAWTPFLLLWMAAPGVQHWIGWQRRSLRRLAAIDPKDQVYLRRIARETWRYFDDLVGPEHNWLPPDNSQEALRIEVAGRTSPTNVGMWLMSAVSACDFGFLTPEQLIERCTHTLATLDKLERCEGHLLNWYDTRTLEPLMPRYVSTVDSGNLIASLWVLEEAIRQLHRQPQLEERALLGLGDTLNVIAERFPPDHTIAIPLNALRALVQTGSSGGEIMSRIRLARELVGKLMESLRWVVADSEARGYWITRLDQQIDAWMQYSGRYLRWVEVLSAPPDEFLRPLGRDAIQMRRDLLAGPLPSWDEMAHGCFETLHQILQPAMDHSLPAQLRSWIEELQSACEQTRMASQELLDRADRLSQRCEALASGMNMQFLYDERRRLFAIGYLVGGPVNFTAHYDLLASEARLGSLVSIAKGDVPMEHWLALGRPYTSTQGQVLLSWSGTMFEYLMPLLFTQSFRNSLLQNACSTAVDRQMEYGRERGVPWGISESAYSALDAHNIYQYRAFGVPWLGLKRGLEQDLVVAPYASALALLVAPQESIRNLKRFEKLGMLGPKGFFESLDFTRERERRGSKGVVVACYMAHHQGMTLMAIANVLLGGIMRKRFHADRRIKAVEPLLFERIPPQASTLVHRPSDEVAIREVTDPAGPTYRVLDEATLIPRLQLLGNERYSTMVTNSGGGYSRWKNFELTRWRSDPTSDDWGMFFYLRDEETKRMWSAAHQPLRTKDPRYTAIFSSDRVEFRRSERGIDSHVEIIVSPEDDVEIRRITLINQSARRRKLGLTSAAELSLAPHEADRAHPAFNKLFIQTEVRPDLQALLAWRRARSENDVPVWMAQLVVGDGDANDTIDYETDRARFLGRGRSWHNPRMRMEGGDGFVLDPAFVILCRLTIEPRERRQYRLVTLAANSREEVMRLIAKYRDAETCDRAFELAWSHAQLEFRYLGIQSDSAFRFMDLASHLLYPNFRMRAPAERLRSNRLGQSRLWAYGISGDLPSVAVVLAAPSGLQLVRDALIAHTYWRLRGLRADLIILNREPSGYEQPLHQQLQQLVSAHSTHTGVDQPGGVFLRKADQIPAEDLNLILAASSAVLGTLQGLLIHQMGNPVGELPLPPLLQHRHMEESPSPPLPFLELPYFNGLGGFTQDGREYAIYLGPDAVTPLPWINVMANPSFGCLVSESGPGCCWFGNSQSNRLTPWNNDPVSDPASEAIYIRDEDSGVYWTPTPRPVRENDAYRARHGQGYTEFEHNSHGLEQTLLTFVPVAEGGGDPVRIQHLRIRNASHKRRRLSVTWYAELTMGSHRETSQMHITSSWDADAKVLSARNAFHPDQGNRVTFATMFPDASSYTADRTGFLDRHGSVSTPAALRRQWLSKRTGPGLDPCFALQTAIELAPGEKKLVTVVLGQGEDAQQARKLATQYRQEEAGVPALTRTRDWWDALLTTIQVKTPVMSVDLLLNRWLLYQALSCRIWGRTALYQSSGAYGFRDQLQDSLALVYAAPDVTRAAILRAASRQFIEGDVQHWWHATSGAGIRSRCSDDLLWLPFAVCHYVEVTGDDTILNTLVTYLDGPRLKDEEHEAYFQPEISNTSETLFEHCRRAIEKGTTKGPHGLPLIGTCDWNDGMNTVGDEGAGESVWLAWFLIDVLNRFARMCDGVRQAEISREYRDRARRLAETVEHTSWDGAWYRRAYFDDGSPLGSSQNTEARIDSLAQSWAVISRAGDPKRAAQAMRSVDEHLIREPDKLVLLFTPPFDVSVPHPGYIMGYPPGVRENGGQYTHAALWVAMAFARLGNGTRAVDVLQMLNPIEHARTPQECRTYQTEPYAVAADVYSLPSQLGRGGWTWYTGSASWMYRVWLEEVLGFHLRGNRLRIAPQIPDDWPGYSITFRYGKTEYRIEIENGGDQPFAEIDLYDDALEHHLKFALASGAPA